MFPYFFKVVNEILIYLLDQMEGTNGNCGDLLVTSGFLTLAKDGPHFQVLRLFLLRSWTCVGISVRHSTHVDGPRMFSFSDFLTASCTDFVKYFFLSLFDGVQIIFG
jgi:hypothetical protein